MSKFFDYELADDYHISHTKVSLSNEFNYTTNFNIQNVSIFMRCGYNTRNKQRWITLTDRSGNVLLSQTFLQHKKECELNFNSNEYNLDYFVTLILKDESKVIPNDYDYINWANDFNLYFIGHEYDISERIKSNLTIVLVGNN